MTNTKPSQMESAREANGKRNGRCRNSDERQTGLELACSRSGLLSCSFNSSLSPSLCARTALLAVFFLQHKCQFLHCLTFICLTPPDEVQQRTK